MLKGEFSLEDLGGPYPGYTTGERWNGWATPSFEYEVGLKIVDDWKATGLDGMEAYYDPKEDQFCFRLGTNEEWECFEGTICQVEGQSQKLYPIGAFCWIWDDSSDSVENDSKHSR